MNEDSELSAKSLRFERNQRDIYNGLKNIGEEIAALYFDGLRILQNHELTTKSYLLAHLAREIEGGIRDIFASGEIKSVERCPQCKKPIKSVSHINEICFALGVDKNDNFAKEWNAVAKEFNKYAHRHGPWKSPRDREAFDSLWRRFEDVLHFLVGSFYSLRKRVDRVLRYAKPTRQILGALPNLLKIEVLNSYFFYKLVSVYWFEPLLQRGYFNPENAPGPQSADEEGYVRIPLWNVLPYLEKVSQQVNKPENEKLIDDLLKIIRDVTEYHKKTKILDNYRTWHYFVKILCNLPNDRIDKDDIKLIRTWLDSKFDTSLQGAEILTKLLPKFLTDNPDDVKKAEMIVYYATDVKLIPKHTKKFKKEIRKEYKELFERPEDKLTEEEKLRKKMFDLEGKKYVTKIDIHWLIMGFINNKLTQSIGEKCSKKLIYDLANRLQKILEKEYPERDADLSYIWMPSLSDYPSFINETEEILTVILRDSILAKARVDERASRSILQEFLNRKFKFPIFKRIALIVINKEWNKYNNVFWQKLDDYSDDFFDNPHYESEVYEILEGHIKKFNENNKKQIQKILEAGPQKNLPKGDSERYINLWKQKWYSALKSDKKFKDLYNRCKKKTRIKEYVASRDGRIQTRVGPGKSPLTAEKILSMPNKKLAEFLSTFKTKDWWEGPTVDGLAETLRDTGSSNPAKFIDNLGPFINTAYLYIYHILWGIREAWNSKVLFDWGKLLAFIKDYINRDNFWSNALPLAGDRWRPQYSEVINSIGSLIQDGTRDDAWAFDGKYNGLATEILEIILTNDHIKKLNKKSDETEMDYIMSMHNTPLGNIIIAVIYLSLRIARLQDKEQKVSTRWNKELRRLYERTFEHDIVETYTVFGQYLPIIMCLDKSWAEEKVKKLEESKLQRFRRPFITGYLNVRRVYDNIYQLESMQNHYRWTLDIGWDTHIREQLVSHIAIGYLRGYEDLFNLLLKKWNPSQILDIINFFWREHLLKSNKKNRDRFRQQIINFWRRVYDRYRETRGGLSDDDEKILSNIVKLTIYLDQIDDEKYNWLMLSASYVHLDHNERWFVEYLDMLKNKGKDTIKTIKYILKIILKMLENYVFQFAQDYMKSIVEFAYELAQKEGNTKIKSLANQICNIFGASGTDYLRDLYEKNNK